VVVDHNPTEVTAAVPISTSDGSQIWAAGAVPLTGLCALGAVAALQGVALRLRPPPVVVLGVAQLAVGVGVVCATAAAVRFG
jgi:hypothetical protein